MAVTDTQTLNMGASMETEEALGIIDALNNATDVLAMDGASVEFLADAPISLGGHGRLKEIAAYKCPRGVFLFFQEPEGPHWAVSGPDAAAALREVHEDELREFVARRLSEVPL
jgi:hypothetical protein